MRIIPHCEESIKVINAYNDIIDIIEGYNLDTETIENEIRSQALRLDLTAMGYQNVALIREFEPDYFVFSTFNGDFNSVGIRPEFTIYIWIKMIF